jgi:hypothetical protein
MPTVILHLPNDDPIMGEIEDLPDMSHHLLILKNPRRKDGKDLPNLEADVTTIIYPIVRLTYIEVMPQAEDDEIIGFVRE